ncbi:MAG: hypothetical protein QXP39_01975 [Candidatus Aenigmatarchaeota archaeon]
MRYLGKYLKNTLIGLGFGLALYFSSCGKPNNNNNDNLNAEICASPVKGTVPLKVHFEDCSPVSEEEYKKLCRYWDVNGDDVVDFTNCKGNLNKAINGIAKNYQDVSGADNGYAAFDYEYTNPGEYTAKLLIQDSRNRTAIDDQLINVMDGNSVEPFCTDTDGGLNYDVSGTTIDNYGSHTDSCEGNTLTEWFCQDNLASSTEYVCPDQCENGACILNPPEVEIKNLKSSFCGYIHTLYFTDADAYFCRNEQTNIEADIIGVAEEYGWENVTEDPTLYETMEGNYVADGKKLYVYFPFNENGDLGIYKFKFWAKNSAGMSEKIISLKTVNIPSYLLGYSQLRPCEVTINGITKRCAYDAPFFSSELPNYPFDTVIQIHCTPIDGDCWDYYSAENDIFNPLNTNFEYPCNGVWGVKTLEFARIDNLIIKSFTDNELIERCGPLGIRERFDCTFEIPITIYGWEVFIITPIDQNQNKDTSPAGCTIWFPDL